MAHIWQLQEAKNKLSEVVEGALKDGPQVITRRGVETAVVLSITDYKKMLVGRKRLSHFFRDSPLTDVDIDLRRDTTPPRNSGAL